MDNKSRIPNGVITSDKVGVADMLEGSPGVFIAPRKPPTWKYMLEEALCCNRPGSLSETFVKDRFSTNLISREALTLYETTRSHA